MNTLQAMLLGLLQGLTEFLPVSSSGHLVVAQELLGVQEPGILLEVALHFGTLLAVILVFARDLARLVRDGLAGLSMRLRGASREDVLEHAPHYATAWAVALGSVPAAIVGLLIKTAVPGTMESLPLVGVCLMFTGLVLLASRRAPEGVGDLVGPRRGFLVGCAQALAILPGISRSGLTIVAGRFLRMPPETAGRFSFVLAVPAMLGAGLLEVPALLEAGGRSSANLTSVAAGTAVAFGAGLAALVWLLRLIRRGQLHWFGLYCLPGGAAILLWSIMGGTT